MHKYTRRSKKQWQQLIESQQASGQSQKSFCQQEKLSVTTFSYWKKKLRQGQEATDPSLEIPTPDAWVELPAELPVGNAWHIELDLGNGVCLRLKQTG